MNVEHQPLEEPGRDRPHLFEKLGGKVLSNLLIRLL